MGCCNFSSWTLLEQFYLNIYKIKGIFFLLSSILIPQFMNAQIADNYQGNNRVLLLFAPDANDPSFQQQLSILTQDLSEVTDRDLVFYKIFSDGGSTPDGKTLSSGKALAFRKNYVINRYEFICILVGKDGTEKLRKREPVSLQELFELIDRMPMRRREIRKLRN